MQVCNITPYELQEGKFWSRESVQILIILAQLHS